MEGVRRKSVKSEKLGVRSEEKRKKTEGVRRKNLKDARRINLLTPNALTPYGI